MFATRGSEPRITRRSESSRQRRACRLVPVRLRTASGSAACTADVRSAICACPHAPKLEHRGFNTHVRSAMCICPHASKLEHRGFNRHARSAMCICPHAKKLEHRGLYRDAARFRWPAAPRLVVQTGGGKPLQCLFARTRSVHPDRRRPRPRSVHPGQPFSTRSVHPTPPRPSTQRVHPEPPSRTRSVHPDRRRPGPRSVHPGRPFSTRDVPRTG